MGSTLSSFGPLSTWVDLAVTEKGAAEGLEALNASPNVVEQVFRGDTATIIVQYLTWRDLAQFARLYPARTEAHLLAIDYLWHHLCAATHPWVHPTTGKSWMLLMAEHRAILVKRGRPVTTFWRPAFARMSAAAVAAVVLALDEIGRGYTIDPMARVYIPRSTLLRGASRSLGWPLNYYDPENIEYTYTPKDYTPEDNYSLSEYNRRKEPPVTNAPRYWKGEFEDNEFVTVTGTSDDDLKLEAVGYNLRAERRRRKLYFSEVDPGIVLARHTADMAFYNPPDNVERADLIYYKRIMDVAGEAVRYLSADERFPFTDDDFDITEGQGRQVTFAATNQ